MDSKNLSLEISQTLKKIAKIKKAITVLKEGS